MSPYKAFEYLCYLVIFILFYQMSEAASVATQANNNTLNADDTGDSSARAHSETKRAFEECEVGFSWMCLKVEFVKILERLAEQDELKIIPGISVVRDHSAREIKNADMMADIARSYPNDPSSRLNGFIIAKLQNLLKTRYLRLKLINDETVAEANAAVETSRKQKYGKKGGMEAIIVAVMMMKGTMLAMGMGAIALIAGKALLAALVALTLSAAVGVKGLASGGGKSTTYEIIQKPVYTSSHSHSISHEDGHAYNGHYASGHGASGYGSYARSLQPESLNVIKTQKEFIN